MTYRRNKTGFGACAATQGKGRRDKISQGERVKARWPSWASHQAFLILTGGLWCAIDSLKLFQLQVDWSSYPPFMLWEVSFPLFLVFFRHMHRASADTGSCSSFPSENKQTQVRPNLRKTYSFHPIFIKIRHILKEHKFVMVLASHYAETVVSLTGTFSETFHCLTGGCCQLDPPVRMSSSQREHTEQIQNVCYFHLEPH